MPLHDVPCATHTRALQAGHTESLLSLYSRVAQSGRTADGEWSDRSSEACANPTERECSGIGAQQAPQPASMTARPEPESGLRARGSTRRGAAHTDRTLRNRLQAVSRLPTVEHAAEPPSSGNCPGPTGCPQLEGPGTFCAPRPAVTSAVHRPARMPSRTARTRHPTRGAPGSGAHPQIWCLSSHASPIRGIPSRRRHAQAPASHTASDPSDLRKHTRAAEFARTACGPRSEGTRCPLHLVVTPL